MQCLRSRKSIVAMEYLATNNEQGITSPHDTCIFSLIRSQSQPQHLFKTIS